MYESLAAGTGVLRVFWAGPVGGVGAFGRGRGMSIRTPRNDTSAWV